MNELFGIKVKSRRSYTFVRSNSIDAFAILANIFNCCTFVHISTILSNITTATVFRLSGTLFTWLSPSSTNCRTTNFFRSVMIYLWA